LRPLNQIYIFLERITHFSPVFRQNAEFLGFPSHFLAKILLLSWKAKKRAWGQGLEKFIIFAL
jgi:hypothetical protein